MRIHSSHKKEGFMKLARENPGRRRHPGRHRRDEAPGPGREGKGGQERVADIPSPLLHGEHSQDGRRNKREKSQVLGKRISVSGSDFVSRWRWRRVLPLSGGGFLPVDSIRAVAIYFFSLIGQRMGNCFLGDRSSKSARWRRRFFFFVDLHFSSLQMREGSRSGTSAKYIYISLSFSPSSSNFSLAALALPWEQSWRAKREMSSQKKVLGFGLSRVFSSSPPPIPLMQLFFGAGIYFFLRFFATPK